jgi:phytoene dehydrogenase-like protein
LFRPDIYADLELERHGLIAVPKDPAMFVPSPDGGASFFVWRDVERTQVELSRIHTNDAEAYGAWCAFWDDAVEVIRPMLETSEAIDPKAYLIDRGRSDLYERLIEGSAADLVSSFFEHPLVQGAFVSQGIIGTWASVRDPGTAWVLAYHAAGGELYGSSGTWGFVRGGMGAVSGSIAASARESGAALFRNSPVTEILVDGGRAVGVRLANGLNVMARYVISAADPKTTFLRLAPEGSLDDAFVDRVTSWSTPGCVLKVNMALRELPDLVARPGRGPQHHGTISIAPSIEYLHEAYTDAQTTGHSAHPFMELFVQSTLDPSLVDGDGHVVSAFTQYIGPPRARGIIGLSESRALGTEAAMATLATYAPNITDAVISMEALGPMELEDRFGLSGGDIFHGSLLPDQCFGRRFDYRTPLPGLYLCGSGARPGGCVMGASGRNAARSVIEDLKGAS